MFRREILKEIKREFLLSTNLGFHVIVWWCQLCTGFGQWLGIYEVQEVSELFVAHRTFCSWVTPEMFGKGYFLRTYNLEI